MKSKIGLGLFGYATGAIAGCFVGRTWELKNNTKKALARQHSLEALIEKNNTLLRHESQEKSVDDDYSDVEGIEAYRELEKLILFKDREDFGEINRRFEAQRHYMEKEKQRIRDINPLLSDGFIDLLADMNLEAARRCLRYKTIREELKNEPESEVNQDTIELYDDLVKTYCCKS